MTFVGITFSEQKVSPSADATLMKAVVSDGILYGCGLNYAGFSLTIAPGHLLLSGRNIQHPISETLSIAGATSGYARVVISIDLSKTSTVDVFEQVEAYIEYASTVDGFSALEQSEINASGVKYQAELCVVALSSGGITGIVRQLPAARANEVVDAIGTFATEVNLEAALTSVFRDMKNGETRRIRFTLEPLGTWSWSGTIFRSSNNYAIMEVSSSAADHASNLSKAFSGGEWLPIEWLNPPMVKGERYRTMERYNGYPVYVGIDPDGKVRKYLEDGNDITLHFSAKLRDMLKAGYMVASNKQIVDSVEDIPADAPENSVFLIPLEAVG